MVWRRSTVPGPDRSAMLLMASLGAEVAEESNPFGPDAVEALAAESRSPGAPASTAADVEAFQARTGLTLPLDLSWVLMEHPGLELRPSAYTRIDRNRIDWLEWADVVEVGRIAQWHEALIDSWVKDSRDGVSILDWARLLVPFAALEGGHHALCFDFGYDEVRPPIIRANDQPLDAPGSWLEYVAESFEGLLLLPLAQEDNPSSLTVETEPTAAALAWKQWRYDQLGPAVTSARYR